MTALNKRMTDTTNPPQTLPSQPSRVPNESTGLNIDEHLKITDPETQEVILEQRA